MSNTDHTDHFIDEVTEAVRRDHLYRMMRKYGWIGILLVVLIVGGAAFNEWNKASARNRSEALGDAILSALKTEDPDMGRAALATLNADGDATAIVGLLMAASDGERLPAEAAENLRAIAANAQLPQIYRDLASLKLVALGAGMSAQEKIDTLAPLAAAGAPFRVLAEEQLAMAEIEAGDVTAAISRLQALLVDDEASQALRRRASQLIVALGGTPEGA